MSGGRQNQDNRMMVQPIKRIFDYLQAKKPVQVWLYELVPVKMEGVIIVRSKLLFDSSDLLVGI
jgi:hypothetical protein